ncbi:uncharacterized protein LOC127262855 [Andrographis paniculata]|uniref:uncharacterized protein LOC127262855 n=1 Tax=Andrographis paniculata TaxID=175694 RepID=UPI0021E9436B|nr:uncharacterized protein LOC127262855 [Andrographis paniculata]
MAPYPAAATTAHDRRRLDRRRLLRYAFTSRVLLLALIILWRSVLSPYDTSASINPPCLSSADSENPAQVLLPSVGSAIERSIVWDGVYFVRVAECGYEYEQTYAFLPLLPLCISFLSKTVFAPLVPLIGYRAVLGLSGYVLNNIVFVFAALCLYLLSIRVLKDQELAFRSSILFCFNPASIFYTSIYSESLYAFLTFGGMNFFINGNDHWATFCFALSGCARSNGVLNAGYFCFRTMQRAKETLCSRKCCIIRMSRILLGGAIRTLFIFAPFISFQTYGYFNICVHRSVDDMRPWCKARLPLLYNYIQSHYWGVGFLRYFQVKQLPNFLLASPILSLALCSLACYVKRWPEVFLSLGLRASSKEKELAGEQPSTAVFSEDVPKVQDDKILKRRKAIIENENLVEQPSRHEAAHRLQFDPVIILPFVIHLGVMAATAFFVMHVQVATRFLSASPPLYWFASGVISSPRVGKRLGHLIWAYCIAYIFLGSVLFSNFYPFT